jgi:hypothetical protein
MKKSMIFICVAMLALISCQNENTPVPAHNPVVNLLLPASGSLYTTGDTVFMSVSMTDEEELHEGFLYIRTATDTIFTFEPFVHELPAYNKDTFWVVNGISATTNAFVTAMAFNHDEGADTVDVSITMVP